MFLSKFFVKQLEFAHNPNVNDFNKAEKGCTEKKCNNTQCEEIT